MKKSIYFGMIAAFIVLIGILFYVNFYSSGDDESDGSLLAVKENGVLIVGTSPPYGAMEFFDESNEIVGIDIDVANEIASSIGVEMEIKDINFDTFTDSLNSGEVDIFISAVTITAERSNEMLFSEPYFNGGQTLVVRGGSDSIKMTRDLENKNIGVEDSGSSLENAILNYVESPVIVKYKDSEEKSYLSKAVEEIQNNNIDAFVIDYVAAIDVVRENPDLRILGDPFTQEYYGIAAKLGNDDLMNEVDRVLRDMKIDGKIKEISDKWLV